MQWWGWVFLLGIAGWIYFPINADWFEASNKAQFNYGFSMGRLTVLCETRNDCHRFSQDQRDLIKERLGRELDWDLEERPQ